MAIHYELAQLLSADGSLYFDEVAKKLQVGAALQARIPSTDQAHALAGTNGVPSETNRFATESDSRLYQTIPVDQCTVGGAALTDANVVAALNTAYAAAVTRGCARIRLPRKAGGWRVGATDKLDWYGGGPTQNIFLDCDPGTEIVLPVGYSGDFLYLRGSGAAPAYWYGGGISNLSVQWVAQDPSNTGRGIVLDSVVSSRFTDLLVANGQGGSGIANANNGIDPSIYNIFHNCVASGNGKNWDLDGLANSQLIGCYSQAAFVTDFKIDRSQSLALIGGAAQSSSPSSGHIFDLSGYGGTSLFVSDFYTEGYSGYTVTMFYCPTPSLTHNRLVVHRYVTGAQLAKFADVTGQWNIDFADIEADATTFIKARSLDSGRTISIRDCGSYYTDPSKFDMDAQSKACTVITYRGDVFVGGSLQANQAIQLATIDVGSEIATTPGAIQYAGNVKPANGIANGAGRLLCSDGVWRTIALDPDSWYNVLAPFAGTGELWWADNGITLAVSKASAWAGMLHGYALSQGTDANRPTVGTSAGFNSKTVLTFALASSTILSNASLTALIKSTDTQPYIALLLSADSIASNAAAVQNALVGFNSGGGTTNPAAYWTGGAGGLGMFTASGAIAVPQSHDTITEGAAMLIEAWTDSSGVQQYARNYNQATFGAAGPHFNAIDVTQLSVGGNLVAGAYYADMKVRGIAVLPSKPPDSVRQALYKFCQTDSGI